jgi:hypothetical protein
MTKSCFRCNETGAITCEGSCGLCLDCPGAVERPKRKKIGSGLDDWLDNGQDTQTV